MTIDQRLERLAERHEALTQTVELLVTESHQLAAENKARDRRLGEIMEGLASLVHVAEIHETGLPNWKVVGPEPGTHDPAA